MSTRVVSHIAPPMVANVTRALVVALAADSLFISGMVLAWAREFYLFIPRRLPDLLIVLGLALAVAAGVKLLAVSRGEPGWWRRSGRVFGLALALTGLPPIVMLAWAITYRVF